jgi:hypothetical protein
VKQRRARLTLHVMSFTDPHPAKETQRSTGTLVEERPETSHGDGGDHERFAHYVRKDKVVESAVMGNTVTALCGKKWVPSRDPKKFPVCPECKEIFESLPAGGDQGDSGS